MRRQLILAIGLIFSASDHLPAYDLTQHQWRHRLLFLIAPQADDPGLVAQQREIALQRDALLDRDIRLFQLFPDRGFVEENPLSAEAALGLRKRLGVTTADRLVILIGKDGGIKRRSALNTDLREILLQIDAMPMRSDEMRAKQKVGIPAPRPDG